MVCRYVYRFWRYVLGYAKYSKGLVTYVTPLFRFFFAGFLKYCHYASVYQISSLYLFSFCRYVRVYAKIYVVTWRRPRPFSRFYSRVLRYCHYASFNQIWSLYSSTRFGDTLGCTPKFMGVTWPRSRPFSSFFSLRLLRYCHDTSVYQISSL